MLNVPEASLHTLPAHKNLQGYLPEILSARTSAACSLGKRDAIPASVPPASITEQIKKVNNIIIERKEKYRSENIGNVVVFRILSIIIKDRKIETNSTWNHYFGDIGFYYPKNENWGGLKSHVHIGKARFRSVKTRADTHERKSGSQSGLSFFFSASFFAFISRAKLIFACTFSEVIFFGLGKLFTSSFLRM